MPLPDPVFNVNTTDDVVVAGACANNVANSCSLREALIEANADNLNDTINVPAGTYTLTLTGANKETAGATAAYGSLDIFHGVTINGAVERLRQSGHPWCRRARTTPTASTRCSPLIPMPVLVLILTFPIW